MAGLTKVSVDELRGGMSVVRFDCAGFMFEYYGKPLPSDCAKLRSFLKSNKVTYALVYEDSILPEDASPTAAIKDYIDQHPAAAEEKPPTPPKLPELTQVMSVHTEAKLMTTTMMNEARMGKMIDTKAAREMVSTLVEQCIKTPEAFISITRLKDFDNYTFMHSVNVSVLAISLAKRLGFSAKDLNNIGFAGLMHDIGKMGVPESILNKPGKLDGPEFEIMKQHTVKGYNYLKAANITEESILQAVRCHHEKSDGSGYPDGLMEAQIPKFAKIISIADVYDAITSERVYSKGMMPAEAIRTLFSWSGRHFNDALVKFFISIMGIYPAGTLVMLDSGELAIIMWPNKKDPMRPKVLVITGPDMAHLDEPFIFNLSSYNARTSTPYKSVVSALNPQDFNINVNEVIAKYLIGNEEEAEEEAAAEGSEKNPLLRQRSAKE
ncbi:MAG: HD-GYP domain-containing protein [Deferribacteraceae bacterium]|nr:HD-GYP domain-containing protein [Deferribacteraceae bacterium]